MPPSISSPAVLSRAARNPLGIEIIPSSSLLGSSAPYPPFPRCAVGRGPPLPSEGDVAQEMRPLREGASRPPAASTDCLKKSRRWTRLIVSSSRQSRVSRGREQWLEIATGVGIHCFGDFLRSSLS